MARLLPRLRGPRYEILPCPLGEREEALGVLYRRLPAAVRIPLVAQSRAEATCGQLDLSGLWIGRRHGRILGAILSQRLAGRAAALWAPEVAPGWGRSLLAAELVRAAVAGLAASGARIIQALLDELAPPCAGPDLARGGLPRITQLAYLSRSTRLPLKAPCDAPRLSWRCYGPETEGTFRATLEASCVGSLDMPELERARSLDDVLATHVATGRFDPSRWLVGRVADEAEAAAILLLSEPPERDAWEIAYLGLTPAARGRGLGRAALAHAVELARPHTSRLDLAVDVRNLPAARLYRATGFVTYDYRTVHLKVVDEPTPR
jgi:ribosomal protein S18 acetylase RimI-like enzyme